MKAEPRPIELTEETRSLLAKADVPAAFVEQFRDYTIAVESLAQPVPWQDGESFLAPPTAPDEGWGARLAKAGTKSFYLTQTSLNLGFLQHVARGLLDFECCAFPGLVTNTFLHGSFFADVFLACMEEPKTEVVYVRFFVIDECGVRKFTPDKLDVDNRGLLKGARYPAYTPKDKKKADHLGRLTKDALDKIEAAVAQATGIWERECVHTPPGEGEAAPPATPMLRFKIATNPDDSGKPFVYALDLEGLLVTYELPLLVPITTPTGEDKFFRAIRTNSYDLCQVLEGDPRRNLTAKDGSKAVKGRRKLVWNNPDKNLDKQLEKQFPIDEAHMKNAMKIANKLAAEAKASGNKKEKERYESWEKLYEESLPGEFEIELRLLGTFGDAVDGRHGEHCINVFVFGDFEDTGRDRGLAGYAEIPGRNVFLDENVILSADGRVLAHEFGHNLGLDDVEDKDNLMYGESSNGEELNEEEQCKPAAERARDPKYKEP